MSNPPEAFKIRVWSKSEPDTVAPMKPLVFVIDNLPTSEETFVEKTDSFLAQLINSNRKMEIIKYIFKILYTSHL